MKRTNRTVSFYDALEITLALWCMFLIVIIKGTL